MWYFIISGMLMLNIAFLKQVLTIFSAIYSKGSPGQDRALSLNTVSVYFQDLVTHCKCLVEEGMNEKMHIQC